MSSEKGPPRRCPKLDLGTLAGVVVGGLPALFLFKIGSLQPRDPTSANHHPDLFQPDPI